MPEAYRSKMTVARKAQGLNREKSPILRGVWQRSAGHAQEAGSFDRLSAVNSESRQLAIGQGVSTARTSGSQDCCCSSAALL
jgi:hypothetical protein